ncbi:hypothetical protein ES703_67542 [subsurface metagenome]
MPYNTLYIMMPTFLYGADKSIYPVLPGCKNLDLLDATNSLIEDYIALSDCFHLAFPGMI